MELIRTTAWSMSFQQAGGIHPLLRFQMAICWLWVALRLWVHLYMMVDHHTGCPECACMPLACVCSLSAVNFSGLSMIWVCLCLSVLPAWLSVLPNLAFWACLSLGVLSTYVYLRAYSIRVLVRYFVLSCVSQSLCRLLTEFRMVLIC